MPRKPFGLATVVLDDGTPLSLREIRPSDRAALRAMFHELSAESKASRFHGHIAELSEPVLRYLTEVDGVDHFAVVALARPSTSSPARLFQRWRTPTKSQEIVAVARLIRLRARCAEVAITVADAFQGRGLGTRLMQVVVDQARRSGTDTLIANVLPTNRAMLRLFAKAGRIVSSAEDGTVTARLAAPARWLEVANG